MLNEIVKTFRPDKNTVIEQNDQDARGRPAQCIGRPARNVQQPFMRRAASGGTLKFSRAGS